MILKFQSQINFKDLENLNIDLPLITKRQFSEKLASEIMKFLVIEERKETHSPMKRLTAEIHVLPPSQYEHVIGMLKTLKGISPQIDSVIHQIAIEL